MKQTKIAQRLAGLALVSTFSIFGAPPPAPSSVKAPPSASAQPANPGAEARNAKILAQVSACLAANSCQVVLIDTAKPLVDLRRKSTSADMGFDVWEQFVAAP